MPLAPPVIKIVLLVSFIIKYLLSYVTIYKSHSTSTRRSIEPSHVGSGLHLDRLVSHGSTASDSLLAHSQDPARAIAGAGLLASAFLSKSASNVRARKAGTRAFMMRFSRPGTTLERFLRRPLRASDTHCSTLIGFNGMVFGSRPNFPSTAVSVNPAASTVT